jgi:GLPGLI family protein
MKIKLAVLAVLLLCGSLYAQKFQGKAIYKTSRKMGADFGVKNKKGSRSDKLTAQINEMLKKQFQKTFVLNFDKTSSLYKEAKNLKTPTAMGSGMNVVLNSFGGGGGSDVLYKNIKDDEYFNQTEIMGKRFLIKDKLKKYDWKLTGETKNIGIYTCYKATYTREVEKSNMSVEDGKVTEKKKKVDVVTTAWYTPSIPVSNGPADYNGLPGLILEVKEGNQTIMCSEIVLNSTDKIKIEEPKKGKVVSQSQYEKIMAKKSKEMMEKFKSRRNSKGNNVEIQIRG